MNLYNNDNVVILINYIIIIVILIIIKTPDLALYILKKWTHVRLFL